MPLQWLRTFGPSIFWLTGLLTCYSATEAKGLAGHWAFLPKMLLLLEIVFCRRYRMLLFLDAIFSGGGRELLVWVT